MEQISRFIVKRRRLIGIIFVILTLISVYLDRFVVLNYDFAKYVPDTTSSISAFNKLEEEFGMPGTERIMFKNVTLTEAAEYNKKIENVDGVDTVMWLDDYVDVNQPIEFIDKELLNEYYKDNSTVMDILFDSDDYSQSTYDAVNKLKEILPDDGSVYFMGSAVTTSATRDNVSREMMIILAIVIPVVIIILLLTTDSYFSPVIFLTVIGISIMLNKGTNVMFESISYITYSISAALQLAISMDYSVFMLHQFTHEKEKGLELEEAMVMTLKEGIVPVMASALTTIAGFIALSFMDFGLGRDLGFVFSKGIILSLLCVICVMPYMILTFNGLIEKTKHKSLLPSFEGFSKRICKHNYLFLIIAIAITVPMYIAQKDNDFKYGAAAIGAGPGSKVYNDEREIIKVFGDSQTMLAMVPNTGYVDCKSLVDDIENITMKTVDNKDAKVVRYAKTVANTIPVGVPDFFAPQDTLKKFKNDKYQRILISVRTDSESDFAFKVAKEVDSKFKKYYNEYYLTGTVPVTIDMKNVIEADYSRVNLLSILAVMLILLFTFKSLVLPVLLISVIEAAIFINMGIPYLSEESILFVGYLIVSTIQLGATIDYAILMTDNYLGYKENLNRKEAIIAALTKSIPSLLTSGGILIICGYAIKYASSITAVSVMGDLIGRGAALSLVLVVTTLPQILYLADPLINLTTLKDEYKIRIGSKVYVVGRRVQDKKKRKSIIRQINKKLIERINRRINKKKEKLEVYKKGLNDRNIRRLSKIIDDLGNLKGKIEKESEEMNDENSDNE